MSLNSMYTSNDVLGARQVKMSLNSMYTSIEVFMEFNDIFLWHAPKQTCKDVYMALNDTFPWHAPKNM